MTNASSRNIIGAMNRIKVDLRLRHATSTAERFVAQAGWGSNRPCAPGGSMHGTWCSLCVERVIKALTYARNYMCHAGSVMLCCIAQVKAHLLLHMMLLSDH